MVSPGGGRDTPLYGQIQELADGQGMVFVLSVLDRVYIFYANLS